MGWTQISKRGRDFIAASAVIASAIFSVIGTASAAPPQANIERLRAEASNVTITRDDWGIAHVHGKTDADAVFGMIYAQAEDDYNRVETNYLTALGRMAEAQGPDALWQDLRQRLFLDPEALKRDYAASPDWLKALMDAWADGLNYYLATHPDMHSRTITRYEPWMTLAFSEGSIGGDIERGVPLDRLKAFYDAPENAVSSKRQNAAGFFPEPTGSNGIAIGPGKSVDGNALLWINPHTSFYFRSELQMTSDAGLDAYGAVTWGQFFVYQGFNHHVGWMHTSTGLDNIDEFAETIVRKGGSLFYRYGDALRPVESKTVTLSYKAADGGMATRSFTTYHTHHGPVIGNADGKWIAVGLMNRPIKALEQSYLRTRAKDYADYIKIAGRKANSSNNTIFADDKGEIAYLHPQFVPIRSDRFDYTRPVDGSDPATDWQGLHALDDVPHVVSPASGWVMNTNNWPWTAAGPDSPKAADFPRYMDQFGENPRGIHVERLMRHNDRFSLSSLTKAGYDSYLPFFTSQVNSLSQAYQALADNDPLKAKLAGPVALLKGWDRRWSSDSHATSLAVFWGDALWSMVAEDADNAHDSIFHWLAWRTSGDQRIQALSRAVDKLTNDFGDWSVPWRRINRYQRNSNAITLDFDDSAPSLPIPFPSNRWGSLASFGPAYDSDTRCLYGTSGNSFIAAVEFGKRVEARAVSVGGESGNPHSPHFNDQVRRYADGNLRPVYFWPDELSGHVEQRYHPGMGEQKLLPDVQIPAKSTPCGR